MASTGIWERGGVASSWRRAVPTIRVMAPNSAKLCTDVSRATAVSRRATVDMGKARPFRLPQVRWAALVWSLVSWRALVWSLVRWRALV